MTSERTGIPPEKLGPDGLCPHGWWDYCVHCEDTVDGCGFHAPMPANGPSSPADSEQLPAEGSGPVSRLRELAAKWRKAAEFWADGASLWAIANRSAFDTCAEELEALLPASTGDVAADASGPRETELASEEAGNER